MKAKNYIFLIAMLAGCWHGMAQAPTITTTVENTVGDTLYYQACVADNFNAGPSGAGVTWDFSHMTPTGTIGRQFYVAPSTCLNGDSFPTANINVQTPSAIQGVNNIGEYLQSSASGIQIRGWELPDITYYYDAEDFLRLPVTFNDSWVDSFHATISPDGSPQYYRRGTISVQADGYGTLKLPTGTVTNVLRVRFVEDYVDDLSSLGAGVVHYTSLLYNWYTPGVKSAVMAYDSAWYTNSSPRKILSYNTNAPAVTGIKGESILSGIYVYPNPASGVVTISAPVSVYDYAISDLSGQVMLSNAATEQQTRINVSGLAGGLYLITVRGGDGGAVTHKMVIN